MRSLASGYADYLTMADAMAYDASNKRMRLYLFPGFSAARAASYPAARMFWSGPKKLKGKTAKKGT